MRNGFLTAGGVSVYARWGVCVALLLLPGSSLLLPLLWLASRRKSRREHARASLAMQGQVWRPMRVCRHALQPRSVEQ